MNQIGKTIFRTALVWAGLASIQFLNAATEPLRPPAVPLVACDPYFSIWSPADKLTDADTVHWTGKPHRLTSLVRIDGQAFRVMGKEPANVPALAQTQLQVLPTRTIYSFEGAGVKLSLTFMTAALPEDIDLLSRPVTYLTYELQSMDGKSHDVSIQFDASGEIAVNEGKQEVVASAAKVGSLTTLRLGSKEQPILAKKGDDLRIDWGYLYVAADASVATGTLVAGHELREAFGTAKTATIKTGIEGAVAADSALATLVFSNIKVSAKPVSRWLMLAYDDEYSIQYMKKNLRPYWRRNGWEAVDLLKAAAKDYKSLQKRCTAFDNELMADLTSAGGEKYAQLCALAYRQCFAAGKFVADDNGQPLQFCKENHSNGCIGTSDVFYPMAPQFLLLGPSLAKSFLVPFMDYAASDHWKFPFAPHDLGTYPQANGQVYGDGERGVNNQMPVEESGNLLILITAIAEMEGNTGFADRYWPQLEKWAEYLKEKGFDPENQLCTDDFAGHLAHNVNLSAKAICGIASFGKLCEMRGDKVKAAEYSQIAKEFAARWVKEANDGDHYRLAFDKPGSWSQKYNATWDRILGLNLWPAETWRKEMDFYKKNVNLYGLPLDNRQPYTKLDWTLWTATLTQNRADFEALLNPVIRFLNATPDRSPMTDWYQTKDAHKVGFTARPVVGGVFLQMLYDKPVWAKWAKRDQTHATNWAPIPKRPVVTIAVPAADKVAAVWRYSTSQPAAGWNQTSFVDSAWRQGESGFGVSETPGATVRTVWNTSDIWLRREILLSKNQLNNLQAWLHHDDEAEVYINGILAVKAGGFTSEYENYELMPAAKAALKPGNNLIAVHCHQISGGQYVDIGFIVIDPMYNKGISTSIK